MTTVQKIDLCYPASWHAPLNPCCAEAARRVENWLRSSGVINNGASEHFFRLADIGHFAGSPFPDAGSEQLETIMSLLALWAYYDDVIEGFGESADISLSNVLSEDSGAPESEAPIEQAWRVLRGRLRARMSQSWLLHHAARFDAWLRSVRAEAEIAARMRGEDVLPGMAQYISMREVNIGLFPTIDLLEYAGGWELTPALRQDPSVLKVERCAAQIVTIQNDLVSYSKDEHSSLPNLINCLVREEQVSTGEAFQCIVHMHDELVVKMLSEEGNLLRHVQDQSLEQWLRGINRMTAGFARWHTSASRFKTEYVMEDGVRVEISLRYQ